MLHKLLLVSLQLATLCSAVELPLIINTWSGPFISATESAYDAIVHHPLAKQRINHNLPSLDAVQAGCGTCQHLQCDFTVGFGGSPDESCETTLDALIIDGNTMNVGSVANLRRVKDAVGVARAVLDKTQHSMISGEQATKFAVQNGFSEEHLETTESLRICKQWRKKGCQPNFRVGVYPNPKSSCGPYTSGFGGSLDTLLVPVQQGLDGQKRSEEPTQSRMSNLSHDTISMIAIDTFGNMAAATSTNGAAHKIPGRVGDGPIPGSGSYVDSEVGGCGATGDGDVMMRFLPCYQAVESMRRGMSPQDAADDAVLRMVRRAPGIKSGIVVVDRQGTVAASASGWAFSYTWRAANMDEAEVREVSPIDQR